MRLATPVPSPPRRATLFLAAVLLPAGSIWAGQGAEAALSEGPVFRAAETSFDGEVTGKTEAVSHAFSFENAGKSDLSVEVHSRSCGCLAGGLEKGTLAPGEKASLTLTYNVPVALPRRQQQYQATAVLATSDPQQPRVTFTMRFAHKLPVTVTPDPVDFGAVNWGEKASRRIAVEFHEPVAGHRVTEAQSSTEWLTVAPWDTAEPGLDASPALEFELRLSERAPAGEVRGSIVLSTDSKEVPFLEVPVKGTVRPLLRATPPRLLWGVVGSEKQHQATVLLRSESAGTVTPAAAECDDPRIAVVLGMGDMPGTWKLEAALKPGSGVGRIKTEIRVLDSSKRSIARVPLLAYIRDKNAVADEEQE